MTASQLGELALSLLSLLHQVGQRDGVDARRLHTLLNEADVPVQRVRSTLYNLAALGYASRAAMSGHFRITPDCKQIPPGTPVRAVPDLRPPEAKRAAVAVPAPTLHGTVTRQHTPNSVFDVERL